MKRLYYLIPLLLTVFYFLSSCSKSTPNSSAPILSVSPQILLKFTAENWDKVKPQINNKKGYWYSEYSQDSSSTVKATVVQPATLKNFDGVDFTLLLYIAKLSERVSLVSLFSSSLVAQLSQKTAYSLIKEFHDKVLAPQTDTSFTYCTYMMKGVATKISLPDALLKIEKEVQVDKLRIQYFTVWTSFILSIERSSNGNFQFRYDCFSTYNPDED